MTVYSKGNSCHEHLLLDKHTVCASLQKYHSVYMMCVLFIQMDVWIDRTHIGELNDILYRYTHIMLPML